MTTATRAEVTAILRKAKELIEENGWIQRRSRASNGICLGAGMTDAADHVLGSYDVKTGGVYRHIFQEAVNALRKVNGISGAIFSWNDTRGRTKEEVLAALDKAILFSEKEAQSS